MEVKPENWSFKEKLKLIEAQTSIVSQTDKKNMVVRQKSDVSSTNRVKMPRPISSTKSQVNPTLKPQSSRDIKRFRKPMPLPKPDRIFANRVTQENQIKVSGIGHTDFIVEQEYMNAREIKSQEEKLTACHNKNQVNQILSPTDHQTATNSHTNTNGQRATDGETGNTVNEFERDCSDYEDPDFVRSTPSTFHPCQKHLSTLADFHNARSFIDNSYSKEKQELIEKPISHEIQDTGLPERQCRLTLNQSQGVEKDRMFESNQIKETQVAKKRIHQNQVHYYLLLLGKTGNGKSALGNSILNRKAFVSKNSTTSVTKCVSHETSEINDRIVTVVDGPGVGDTDLAAEEAQNFVIEALSSAVAANPKGYHAFLLVLKLGGRLTNEEKGTIEFLKKIFGKNFFRKFGVLVMTYGDQWERDADFHEWVLQQEGVLADLVRECNHRIILFDNKTGKKEEKKSQFNELMRIIENLTIENCRYSNEHFELARSERDSIMLESKKPVIIEETMIEANLIMQGLQSNRDSYENAKSVADLNGLLERAKKLHESLLRDDNSTGILKDMISHVNSVQNTILTEIQLSQRLSEINKKMEQKEMERQQQYVSDVEKLRKEFDKCYLEEKMMGKWDTIRKEELWKKEKDECESKIKTLQEEKNNMYKQLKLIEKLNRDSFLSKVQTKISNAFKYKIKEKRKSETQ